MCVRHCCFISERGSIDRLYPESARFYDLQPIRHNTPFNLVFHVEVKVPDLTMNAPIITDKQIMSLCRVDENIQNLINLKPWVLFVVVFY